MSDLVPIVFHVPTALNSGEPVNPWAISQLMTEALDLGGGMTIIQAEGAWRNPEGYILREPVLRVLVAVPEDEVEPLVEMLNQRLKGDDFQQQAVYMEVSGVPSIR